jgi:ATP-dependent DNA helicase RecG
MHPATTTSILHQLIASWENECVEFKEANDNFPTSDIGKYFSALSNEANLRARSAGWLVFGVKDHDHSIVGTSYRESSDRLHSLKKQVADGADPSITFREIHELHLPEGRVLLFEIPAAPRGTPIAWNGHFYARAHESLTALDLAKQDEIRAQSINEDWSAGICEGATLADLDPAAIAKARETFIMKFNGRIPEAEICAWTDSEFLDRAKITIRGKITRAAILLLGRSESTHFLSPHVAEMTWRLEGEETAYEHFHPPFFLTSTLLYQRIRNLRLTLLPPGQMIPLEIPKYDQRIVLEALHNCIAHQDYQLNERIIVTERTSGLDFQNAGSFFDGSPDDYLVSHRTPARYRNRFLAEAMVNLRMIDTMGFGIRQVMFRGQAKRFLPLPEYDLSQPGHVTLHLAGQFLDENYSRTLQAHPDLEWTDILALDRIQKGHVPDESVLRSLRKRGLIEGRKPHLRITPDLAAQPEARADYLRHRAFDDDYYCKLILDYLAEFGSGKRADFERLLEKKLSDALSLNQKERKIGNLLQLLRRQGKIEAEGIKKTAVWKLVPSTPSEPPDVVRRSQT